MFSLEKRMLGSKFYLQIFEQWLRYPFCSQKFHSRVKKTHSCYTKMKYGVLWVRAKGVPALGWGAGEGSSGGFLKEATWERIFKGEHVQSTSLSWHNVPSKKALGENQEYFYLMAHCHVWTKELFFFTRSIPATSELQENVACHGWMYKVFFKSLT